MRRNAAAVERTLRALRAGASVLVKAHNLKPPKLKAIGKPGSWVDPDATEAP